jgi:hypothetical protein
LLLVHDKSTALSLVVVVVVHRVGERIALDFVGQGRQQHDNEYEYWPAQARRRAMLQNKPSFDLN